MNNLSGEHLLSKWTGKTCFIVLVEDNADDEYLSRKALEKLGIDIELKVARDGAEAISILCESEQEPDLVLLDLKLPKYSGLEVLQAVRSDPDNPSPPIVVFTSTDDPNEKRRCMSEGANDFITKPLDADVYMELVTKASTRWLTEGLENECA